MAMSFKLLAVIEVERARHVFLWSFQIISEKGKQGVALDDLEE